MSDIYTLIRSIIGDSVSPYVIADLNILKYLDKAIEKLSLIAGTKEVEDIVITSSDITAGYKDLGNEVVKILLADLPDYAYQIDGARVNFVGDYVNAGTYRFEYVKGYKKFDGTLRDNSYFDYPMPEADLAIVFYALSLYLFEGGIIKASGGNNVITSKSEEGLSISYGTGGEIIASVGTPAKLQAEALRMMYNLPKASRNLFFSIQI